MQIEIAQESPELKGVDLESLRVLIADDEAIICKTLSLFLSHIGIKNIKTVRDGSCAVEELCINSYDYIFVDLMMPRLTGLDVLKKVSESHPLCNVIIMTGFPSMDTVIEAMHYGASDFLVKPFRFDDVKIGLERMQAVRRLKEKNWQLHEELNKKKEVEELNYELEKRIRLQTILYNIVDSLSKINRSESLYHYIVRKAADSCNARRACFMIYDQGNSHLLGIAQEGLTEKFAGLQAPFRTDSEGTRILQEDFLCRHFGVSFHTVLPLNTVTRVNGLMTVPFNIRNEPFGVLLLGEKTGQEGFDNEDEFIIKFLAEKAALSIENIALYDNLKESLIATLKSLVSAIEAKDPYTRQHSSRVTEYASRIALKMNCDYEDLQKLASVAPLHDIGKIGVNDAILNKPGRLTREEFSHIMAHPLIGVNIVSPLGLDTEELSVIRNHHERWDGQGYPDHLCGPQIPMLARILAVADAFDAMNSDRAYRKALPSADCMQELRKGCGTQFDPRVVEVALDVLSQ
ncbi:MAG: response regulator [Desulfobacteraceae bacterium]|nr:MAG: response regulator [Desulfobacteraceae bacterium]